MSGFQLLNDPLAMFVIGLVLLILFFWYFATDSDRKKYTIGASLTAGLCALSAFALFPKDGKSPLKGGIDIVGGASFTLRVQPNLDETTGKPIPLQPAALDEALKTIEKRLNTLGTKDMLITKQGSDRIIVNMPGVNEEETEEIKKTLEKVAKLELREVNSKGYMPGPDGRTLADRVAAGEEIEPGFKAFPFVRKDKEGNAIPRHILLNRRVALDGSDIQTAYPDYARPGHINVSLTSAGADKMLALTSPMVKGQDSIAIVLDGEVLSAPTVQATLSKQFEISGMDGTKGAEELSSALMNPLKNPLLVDNVRKISPTMGDAIVQQGVFAGIVGLAATFLFVLIYYRLAGLVATIALVVNGVLLFGLMAMFGFTFTLPGIAGMVLTIGMAVDSNVLIYERLREEIAAGKSLKSALAAAYDKAFSAIFDSNATTLITALILFWLASGTVKGFAITLIIGLAASLFSAILVTRVLFYWGIEAKVFQKLSFLDLIKSTNFDFMGKRRIALVISSLLFLATIVGFTWKRGDCLGVDFKGGTVITFPLGKELIAQAQAEAAIAEVQKSREAFVQEESSPASGNLLTIRCDQADAENLIAKMRATFPILGEKVSTPGKEGEAAKESYKIPSDTEVVSATMGAEALQSSFIALVLGMLGILVYITIRFEFSFAIGAFIALLHDVLVTVGLVVLFGQELTLIHVGAILTIAGYSINDTIVVFDRIRETLVYRSGNLETIMNEAVNATLSRTLLTSVTTIFTVTILALFGGMALKDFSVMILLGLLIGTYSSIFVASPVVLWWTRKSGGASLRDEILATELRNQPKAEA